MKPEKGNPFAHITSALGVCRFLYRSNGLTRNHYSCKTATQILMKWIEDHPENPYPDRDEKKRLAMDANMTVKQLADWFGNARRRRKRMQEDDDHMANREREIREATMRDQ